MLCWKTVSTGPVIENVNTAGVVDWTIGGLTGIVVLEIFPADGPAQELSRRTAGSRDKMEALHAKLIVPSREISNGRESLIDE